MSPVIQIVGHWGRVQGGAGLTVLPDCAHPFCAKYDSKCLVISFLQYWVGGNCTWFRDTDLPQASEVLSGRSKKMDQVSVLVSPLEEDKRYFSMAAWLRGEEGPDRAERGEFGRRWEGENNSCLVWRGHQSQKHSLRNPREPQWTACECVGNIIRAVGVQADGQRAADRGQAARAPRRLRAPVGSIRKLCCPVGEAPIGYIWDIWASPWIMTMWDYNKWLRIRLFGEKKSTNIKKL